MTLVCVAVEYPEGKAGELSSPLGEGNVHQAVAGTDRDCCRKPVGAGQPFLLSPNQQFILWTLNCSRTCVVLTYFTRFSAIAPPNVCQSVDGF